MRAGTVLLVLVSVMLSSTAQLLLKKGMSAQGIQAAFGERPGLVRAVVAVATNPVVLGGLVAFGLSALVWLVVLARIDVSLAYPCVALGIVLTVLGGVVLFGEPVTPLRLAGLLAISGGVILVALG